VAFVGLIVVLAILAAVLTGGRWHPFTHELLRAPGYVVVAVLAQVLGAVLADHSSADWVYPTGLVVSAISALIFCIANLRVAGVALVALGLVLNAVVVARNGAMPVSIAAASRAGVSTLTIATGEDPRHEIAGRGSVWRGLGDVIPVPMPARPEVISPGDLLVAAGLAQFIVMTSRRRHEEHDADAGHWDDAWKAAHELSITPWRS
jgi:hypothetical protein